MALTYTTNDFYTEINNQMSLVQGYTPPNMTLIPNSSKQDILSALVPTTKGPMSAYSKIGAPMSVPAGTPLSALGNVPASAQPEVSKTPETPSIDISSLIPTMNSERFDKFRAIWGTTGNKDKDYQRYIKTAAMATYGEAAANAIGGIASAAADITAYNKLVKDTVATKDQYETQKKILDTNINNTITALNENLQENMANLDVMMAGRNVDLSSQSIVGDKVKGAMDLGQDIAKMQTENSLQKSLLDLEYARNVREAKQQRIDGTINAVLQGIGSVASSALMLV
jgi:hypothetical protein